MIILASTTDKIQVKAGSAGKIDVHSSWVDNASGVITPGRTNTTITTATTADVVAAPGASTYRNIKMLVVRNNHATVQNAVTFVHTDGTTPVTLWYGVLLPGMSVQVYETGQVSVFSAGGLLLSPNSTGSLYNSSTATVSASFATDTYLNGSQIVIPGQRPRVGTKFKCVFDITKTAAGTATSIVNLRYGNNGTTADTAICTFTFGAGTAAAATGTFSVEGIFRSVGAGTSSVVVGNCHLDDLSTTGISSTIKSVSVVSTGFDSTTATYLGVSFNGGTSFSGTNNLVYAELSNI
jgi:hypothetical protein